MVHNSHLCSAVTSWGFCSSRCSIRVVSSIIVDLPYERLNANQFRRLSSRLHILPYEVPLGKGGHSQVLPTLVGQARVGAEVCAPRTRTVLTFTRYAPPGTTGSQAD
jgi:hypothetical protein